MTTSPSDDQLETTTTTTSRPNANRFNNRWAVLLLGILLGVLLLGAIRFATYHHDEVHYHANFAVFIDGKREDFKNPQYYEEVKLCDLHGSTPQSRTHMHDEENGVIHVHDAAVTWGQFFENLGWMIGPDFIQTTDKLYVGDETNKLNITLNGDDLTDVTTITNQVIQDKDRLLVSYGPTDQTVLAEEYKLVPSSAANYDAKPDPASCGGHESPSISDRFRSIL